MPEKIRFGSPVPIRLALASQMATTLCSMATSLAPEGSRPRAMLHSESPGLTTTEPELEAELLDPEDPEDPEDFEDPADPLELERVRGAPRSTTATTRTR